MSFKLSISGDNGEFKEIGQSDNLDLSISRQYKQDKINFEGSMEITVGARFQLITDEQYRLINDSKKGYDEFVKDFEKKHNLHSPTRSNRVPV